MSQTQNSPPMKNSKERKRDPAAEYAIAMVALSSVIAVFVTYITHIHDKTASQAFLFLKLFFAVGIVIVLFRILEKRYDWFSETHLEPDYSPILGKWLIVTDRNDRQFSICTISQTPDGELFYDGHGINNMNCLRGSYFSSFTVSFDENSRRMLFNNNAYLIGYPSEVEEAGQTEAAKKLNTALNQKAINAPNVGNVTDENLCTKCKREKERTSGGDNVENYGQITFTYMGDHKQYTRAVGYFLDVDGSYVEKSKMSLCRLTDAEFKEIYDASDKILNDTKKALLDDIRDV